MLGGMITRCGIVGVLAFLIGCEHIYRIERDATVSAPIDSTCVVAAIESVDAVNYLLAEDFGDIEHFYYEIPVGFVQGELDYVSPSISLSRSSSGLEFRHMLMSINQKIPKEDADVMRPIMDGIESAIESSCELVGFDASIVEECLGVSCSNTNE
jgi:hypothetical protein